MCKLLFCLRNGVIIYLNTHSQSAKPHRSYQTPYGDSGCCVSVYVWYLRIRLQSQCCCRQGGGPAQNDCQASSAKPAMFKLKWLILSGEFHTLIAKLLNIFLSPAQYSKKNEACAFSQNGEVIFSILFNCLYGYTTSERSTWFPRKPSDKMTNTIRHHAAVLPLESIRGFCYHTCWDKCD